MTPAPSRTRWKTSPATLARVRLAAAREAAHRLGANDFDVVVASHCPLQQGAAQRFPEQAGRGAAPDPDRALPHHIGGRSVGTAERVLDDLAGAVAHPVQWYDATRVMAELGATCAVQMRPARLLTSAVPSITSIALSDNDFGSGAATTRRISGPLGR
jgi:malonate decarboxylase epsilon subunit